MKKLLFLNLICLFYVCVLPSFSLDPIQDNLQRQNSAVTEKKEFNPKPASASIYNLGLKSYENGDLDSAASFFKQAADLDPNFVDAYYNLGVIYKKQQDFPLAIHSFKKAYDINPQDHEVLYELANSYFLQNDYENAKKYFLLLPSDSLKYAQSRQNLEKINNYLTLQNSPPEKKQEIIDSPKFQGQLLVDTLGRPKETEEEVTESQASRVVARNDSTNNNIQIQQAPSQIVINNLPPSQNPAGTNELKIVKDDFSGPTGITKDSQNNIYVANFKNDTIERITPGGKREIFFTKGGIKGPVGLAIDGSDNVYVANYSGDSILKITQDKQVSLLKDGIKKPYYLYYDAFANKLFITVQGNDSLVEIDTVSRQPLTAR